MKRYTERPLSTSHVRRAHIGLIENPLDFIDDDHMREREICALIDRLVAASPVQSGARQMVLSFLKDQLPHHLADEEIDLFPLMLKRCDPEEDIKIVIDRLQSDHLHALADAPAIAALIEANKAGGAAFCEMDRAKLADFATHARRHLILENAIILPIARAHLTKDDLKIMRQRMLERRGLCCPQ